MFHLKDVRVKNVFEIESLKLDANVISIEGQSGTGKSTLLRLLNHLDSPASGVIHFKDQQVNRIEPLHLRRKVVMLPQNPVIFSGNIKDNLNIGLLFSGQKEASDHILKGLLEDLRLDKSLDTSASELSGGEQQRLSLGRILLMKETEVFLLDEPSSDLDNDTTEHIISHFLKTSKKHDQQTIMVTHDTLLSKKFADEVINMDEYSVKLKTGGK